MSIKVRDILNLELFNKNELEIIAGKDGLNRKIRRVSAFDCPLGGDVVDKKIICKGDFFVTSLFVVKDNLEDMIELFNILIHSNSSGICVINEFITDFPESIIQIADENSFPILLVDKDVPYGEIIMGIVELIIKDKEDIINEMRIEKLLSTDNYEEIIKISHDINDNFMRNFVVFYLKDIGYGSNCQYIEENVNNKAMWSAVRYEDGILLIITNDEFAKLKSQYDYILDLVDSSCDEYVLGISNFYNNIIYLKKAIIEALTSGNFSDIFHKKIIKYEDLQVYSLLLPIKHRVEMMEFYNRLALPLKKYDEKFNTNLFETAICFVENDGNYGETANELFQHENTIRYRISKIKQLLNMEDKEIEFLTQLSIMTKIYRLLQ